MVSPGRRHRHDARVTAFRRGRDGGVQPAIHGVGFGLLLGGQGQQVALRAVDEREIVDEQDRRPRRALVNRSQHANQIVGEMGEFARTRRWGGLGIAVLRTYPDDRADRLATVGHDSSDVADVVAAHRDGHQRGVGGEHVDLWSTRPSRLGAVDHVGHDGARATRVGECESEAPRDQTGIVVGRAHAPLVGQPRPTRSRRI